jgi:hypothetical protein
MLQLQIKYRLGIIGIEQTPGQMHIRCQPADMEIQQELGQLEVRREPPKVEIDLKEAFGDLGMRKPDQIAWELRTKAWQTFRYGLDRVVSEGDRLGRIELEGQPIVELARENFAEHKELNVAAVPKKRPEIKPVGGDFAFQYHVGGVEIKIEPKTPEISYYPGSIRIYWLQEPWLEMEVVGSNVDLWV